MKEKIFAKLKQEYSALGLGDAVLKSHASALAATGLVTDDNIDAVVASQRGELESLQKSNDKRVTDALEKERKKHEEEAKQAADATAKLKQRIEELEKANNKPEPTPAPGNNPTPVPSTDARYDELKKMLEDLIASGKTKDDAHAAAVAANDKARQELEAKVKELTDKNAAAEAAAAKAARNSMILAKAKELGVPQWRIDEGFNLAEDATEETIAETLTKVANNISTNLLPGNRGVFPISGGEPTKEDIASLAATIVK